MRSLIVSIVILLFITPVAAATPQRPDIVIVDGVVYALPDTSDSGMELPLEVFWKSSATRPKLSSGRGGGGITSLHRGYVAIWEVTDQALYLRGLDAWHGDSRASIKTIFPAACEGGRVKADWYTALLELSTGYYPTPTVMGFSLPFRRGDLLPPDQVFYTMDPFEFPSPPCEQIPDLVLFDSKVYKLAPGASMAALSLESVWSSAEMRPRLTSSPYGGMSKCCLRGYVAIWEIEGRSLYLKGLDAWTYDRKADLKVIFPQNYRDGKVKAEWFSGALTLNTTEHPQLEAAAPRVTLHFKDGDLQPPAPYFPPAALQASTADWYSKHLTALQEPSLYAMRTERGTEVYRFLWLRSFHHPVAVRIVCKEDGDMIVCKMCAGAGGYEPGRLILNRSALFSPQQKTQLKTLLESSGFWELSSKDTGFGLDGSQWIVEAVKDGRYHIVDRWTPQSGAVRDLGLFFIQAGNFIEETIY